MSKPSLSHPVGRVRLVAMIEGISFLLLLGVAMPLKYLADRPEAVRWVGLAHGILFIVLLLLVAGAWGARKLSTKDSALVFLASLLPFGPFLIDRRLARDEAAVSPGPTGDGGDSGAPEPVE